MGDWQERANKRHDARHTKSSDEPTGPASKKKNTKRWCRGKVGKEHEPKCVRYNDAKRDNLGAKGSVNYSDGWRLLVCSICGKELKHYYPFGSNPKPDWVDK